MAWAEAPEAHGRNRRDTSTRATSAVVRTTTDEIVHLEQRDNIDMGRADHVADWIAAFTGSMPFLLTHALALTLWMTLGPILEFDPFPYDLLGLFLAIEAIALSTFVLMTQNRQAQKADRRAKVDLQINAIAEDKVTKLMEMVAEIHDHIGIEHDGDDQLEEMRRKTDVAELADAVDEAEARMFPESADGPESALDTED
jgi:uncharacterized membrane protein